MKILNRFTHKLIFECNNETLKTTVEKTTQWSCTLFLGMIFMYSATSMKTRNF